MRIKKMDCSNPSYRGCKSLDEARNRGCIYASFCKYQG